MTNPWATFLLLRYLKSLIYNSIAELRNNKLSEARAQVVKSILVNAGVPEQNIKMKWYGKSRYGEFKYADKSEYRRVTISVE